MDESNRMVEDLRVKRFNRNSANVAFSNARRKLGIKGRRRKAVRVRKPAAAAGRRTTAKAASSGDTLNFNVLKLARKFIAEAGGAEAAQAAIQQVAALQIDS